MLYKPHQQLFCRSTSVTEKNDIGECQFVNEVALLATSHAGAEEAIRAYHSTATAFKLTVSYSKIEFLVACMRILQCIQFLASVISIGCR